MPYPNMPKSKWSKMESCVDSVKAKGDSVNPYAVCYQSIIGEIVDMVKKRHQKKEK